MLSNTATPRYYAEFREKVVSGIIPVCEMISLQMNRIDARIADPRYYYDDRAVEGFIAFCEEELVLTDGSPLVMLDEFKLWAEDALSWSYFIERDVYHRDQETGEGHYERRAVRKRLTKKQYLIVARGAAKSMYDACMQVYFLVMDFATTHQVVCAPTMKQALETISPIQTAISRARGPLFSMLTEGSMQNTKATRANRVKLASTKEGIVNYLSNSLVQIRPMRIDKLQGLRSKYNTVDEWLSCPIREDPVGALEQGASKHDNYFILATSSEGTIRNAAGDDIKIELTTILHGDYVADHISIWWYRLDDIKEVGIPGTWLKANPCLDKTIKYETYHADVERADKIPSTRNDIYAKRFGIPMEGYTYYFTHEETLPRPYRSYWKMPCAMGADLSCGDDFCAFTFLFPLSVGFGIKTRCYITEHTYGNVSLSMLEKYRDFIAEGSLIIMPGLVLNMMEVYEDLIAFIDSEEYDVMCFGYDPYNAREFVERWLQEHAEYGVEAVKQGSRTESVPLGELKTYAGGGSLHFDQQLFSFTMGNCMVLEDTNGNRKLYKVRADRKIDAVAALVDAYVVYKHYQDSF
jgi:phage terminase large subunit-like protein